MRDSHDGHLVDGIARAIDASSIVSAEAQAVRMACVMAHSYNLSDGYQSLRFRDRSSLGK